MSVLATAPLILRRRGGLTDVLPVTGFAASAAILTTVLGGLGAFVSRASHVDLNSFTPEASLMSTLLICAMVATALLVPSAMGLGTAAARLSLSRREWDLAAVRLVGGTSAQVGALAVADVMAQALVGSAIGIVVHLAVTPALSHLDFGIDAFSAGELMLPVWGYVLMLLALVVMSGLSALLGLAGVVISPLGVAQQSRTVRLSVLRLAVWVGAIVLFIASFSLLPRILGPVAGTMTIGVVLAVMMALVVGSVNIVGPFVVWAAARVIAALAPRPALLVGARRLAADPRGGWRTVSGITFGLVIAGFLTLLSVVGSSTDPSDMAFTHALRTGGYLTLGIAAVLAAVSTGIAQTARVLDQADVYRSQHMAGAPVAALQRARMAEVGIPLALAAVIAGLSAAGLLSTVMTGGFAVVAILQYLAAAVGALVLVVLAMAVSAPLVGRVARSGD